MEDVGEYLDIPIGVAVFLFDGPLLLIGKRGSRARYAPGIWALPGGLCESGEMLQETVAREIKEETSIDVLDSKPLEVTIHDHGGSRVRVFWMLATAWKGTAKIMEPEKCECWEWHSLPWIFDNIEQTKEQADWTPETIWRRIMKSYGMFEVENR